MKVILLQNIEKVGASGEVINVKKGYARNFLIPRKLAIYATPQNMKKLSTIKTVLAEEEQKKLIELKNLAEKIGSLNLSFVRKTDEQDHMFGSVSESDIIHALHEQGIEIPKSAVVMEKHFKELGEHKVQIRLHKEVSTELNLNIAKEQE
ncbi:MAG: 50S ribosomal protein L9 [Candidatus Cloacimonetes bacterium]|nr:50S ribosomal protein L9 [Candidatus Cloacimonadota bacterium]